MLERWIRATVRHRFSILATWLLIIAIGFLAAPKLNDHLTTSLSVPGSESARADAILAQAFNENIEGTFTVFLKFKQASRSEIAGFKESIELAAKVIPTAVVTQQRAVGGVLFASIGTAFSLPKAASYTNALRAALDNEGLSRAKVTGPPAIYRDVTPILGDDLRRGEVIAVVLAFFLLILVLGMCRAIVVPFIFAAATISLAISLVYLLAQKILMVFYVPNIIELIGLGLAIDYSLLIVHRFRVEIMENPEISIEDAILQTMQTAGRTVILSGFSVAIGLATLFLVPVPFVRSLGIAGLIVPITAIIATLTLQPALLSYLGSQGVTAKSFKGLMTRRDVTTGFIAGVAQFVVRKPLSVLLSSLALLAVIASSVFWLQITPSSLTATPANLESAKALIIATDRGGPGIITPHQIVIDLGAPDRATTPWALKASAELTKRLLKDPEIFVVAAGKEAPFVEESGRYLRILVIGRHEMGAKRTQKLVHELREKYLPEAGFPRGTHIYLGGAPAQGVDLLQKIFNSFPWIVLLALALAFLILLRAFRSILLPLKAILLDLVSIAVSYASLVIVFRFGIGSSLFGTYQLDQIEAWVLVFLFAVLFGLSMDYEVFLVSRMREAWKRGASNSEAIIEGLVHTSGVITAAAIILIAALSGFIGGHFAGLQQLGIGLAFGILIDATIIRGLLLPSAMVLLGKWNWWLPKTIFGISNSKALPLEERETRL